MSTDEQSALNRRVAEALGYAVEETHSSPRTDGNALCYWLRRNGVAGDNSTGVYGWGRYPTPEGAWGQIPNFCTDPAAADLVRQEIERRGWWWATQNFLYTEGEGKSHQATIIAGTKPFRARCESPHHALCLAFLAAHDAQQEQEAKQ